MLAALSTSVALAAPVSEAAALCRSSWASVPSFGWNGFAALDAVSSSDVWAVGKSSGISPVAHFDGTTWSVLPAPARRHRTAVEALASNDVWTVAKDSMAGPNSIEHFDGASWSTLLLPREVEVTDLAALARDDVWAVGSISDGSQTRTPYVQHWNGTGWQPVVNVTRGDFQSTYGSVQSVSGVSANDVWAVGIRAVSDLNRPTEGDKRTLIEHWDGSRWTLVPSPQPDAASGPYNREGVSAIAADDGWAVGSTNGIGTPTQALIEHWDGTSWTVVPIPNVGVSSRLHAIAVVSAGDVWAVGEAAQMDAPLESLIMHWDGTSWSAVAPVFTDRRLMAVTATADGAVFAAGGPLYDLCEVRVLDADISGGGSGKAVLGTTVGFNFARANGSIHRLQDTLGLNLFDSGPRGPGSSFTYAFPAAGVFGVRDTANGVTFPISVSMKSGGRTITPAMTSEYAIQWGLGSPPPGAVYDVQLRRVAANYTDFLTGTSAAGATFVPGALGCPCKVRARLRNATTGAASGWSIAIPIDP
jgi:hypothetical protein